MEEKESAGPAFFFVLGDSGHDDKMAASALNASSKIHLSGNAVQA